MGTRLASFPNSRIKPRPARTAGVTPIVSLPDSLVTLIAAANIDRTSIMVRNLDASVTMKYGYASDINAADKGFSLKAGETVSLDDPGDIYGYQTSGGAILMSYDEGVG